MKKGHQSRIQTAYYWRKGNEGTHAHIQQRLDLTRLAADMSIRMTGAGDVLDGCVPGHAFVGCCMGGGEEEGGEEGEG